MVKYQLRPTLAETLRNHDENPVASTMIGMRNERFPNIACDHFESMSGHENILENRAKIAGPR